MQKAIKENHQENPHLSSTLSPEVGSGVFWEDEDSEDVLMSSPESRSFLRNVFKL